MLISPKEASLCKKLIASSGSNTTVVTVNRRLANYLRNQFDHCQQQLLPSSIHSSQLGVWQSIDILPFDSWIKRCWSESQDERVVLNDFQEQKLWERIIAQSDLHNALLRIDKTAQRIKQAWQLLQHWNVFLETLHNDATFDSQAFVTWARDFIKICAENQYIDQSSVLGLVNAGFKSGGIAPTKQLVFAGFDHLSPQIETLIVTLKSLGTQIEFFENNSTAEMKAVVGLADQQQEFYAMARWAQQCLIQQNDGGTIGCIVPNLSENRYQIERIFTEVFSPLSSLPTQQPPFNISIGKSLNDYPLIQQALSTFKLAFDEISIAAMSRWLRSPFLASAEQEMSARATLDLELHESGELQTSFRTVMALAQQSQAAYHCPILVKHLQKFIDALKALPTSQLPSSWFTFFNSVLHTIGWPGERTLNSEEYQTLQRWKLMLTEFSGLDFLLHNITCDTAIHVLQQLSKDIIFQPQTETTAIQILGVLEASGLQFDHLWITGMNEESWPPNNQPNAFIPIKLQRQLGMPHASIPIEFEFYQKLTERLIHSSKQIIFSYPLQAEDRVLRLSPLLKHLPQITAKDLSLAIFQDYNHLLFRTRDLESFEDWQAPMIGATEKIGGGSSLLKNQANCPFSAFAKFRLHADGIKSATIGLDPATRGLLIHSALEHIWNSINDKQQLDILSDTALENIINNAINETLRLHTAEKPLVFKKYFTQIEQQRLKKILLAWVNYEKNRPPFKVLAKEQVQQIKLGNIELKVRIDRIDQLEDGSHIIIDYKTGETSIWNWFDERSSEPQLPLYCVTSDKVVSGIVFAQVSSQKIGFKGIAINDTCLADLTPLTKVPEEFGQIWQTIVDQWRLNLIKLSNEYYSGNAKVNPKEWPKTCQFCEFKTLCRIHEKTNCRAD